MSRLVRMDHSGHTELAEWSRGRSGRLTTARRELFEEQLSGGYMGVAKLPDDTYEQVKRAAPRRRARCPPAPDRRRLEPGGALGMAEAAAACPELANVCVASAHRRARRCSCASGCRPPTRPSTARR